MGNGEWRVESGEWGVGSEEWGVVGKAGHMSGQMILRLHNDQETTKNSYN